MTINIATEPTNTIKLQNEAQDYSKIHPIIKLLKKSFIEEL